MEAVEFWKYLFTKNSINKNKKLILFGAGDAGIKYLKYLKKLNTIKNVDYFCDNDINKHGNYIEDIKIISPEELVDVKEKIIIITSMYDYEISQQLDNMGIENYI